MELISAIKPDILAKGADYEGKVVVGSDIAKEVRLVQFVEGKSTTKIIERTQQKCGNDTARDAFASSRYSKNIEHLQSHIYTACIIASEALKTVINPFVWQWWQCRGCATHCSGA